MPSLTAEELKEKIRKFSDEIYNKQKLDNADEIYSPEMVRHFPMSGEAIRGPEAWKERVRHLWAAFPDVEMTIEDMIVEGNTVAQRWTMTGTHQGVYYGIPPTGKRVTFTGMGFARFDDEGRLVEVWGEVNMLGLMQQLGVAPGPG